MIISKTQTCEKCGDEFESGDDSIVCVLCGLKEHLEENMEDMPPEFIKLIDERFWDLV